MGYGNNLLLGQHEKKKSKMMEKHLVPDDKRYT